MGWAEEVLADLPVGWWPCNEGTGTPQDESGNGHHATLSAGGGTWTTDAPYGDVLLVGDADWTTTAEVPGNACTITWAAKLTYVSDIGHVWVYGSDGAGSNLSGHVWSLDAGATSDIDADAANPTPVTASANSTNNPVVDEWAHYAITASGTTITLYVNGTSVDTATLGTATTADLPVGFGGNPSIEA